MRATRFALVTFAGLALASVVRSEVPGDAPGVRSLEGVEDTQTEARARTELPGTVTAVDARSGSVTVRAAGVEMPLQLSPEQAKELRSGTPVTVLIDLVVRPPAPGTPGGGPAPPNATSPEREVHRPTPNEPAVQPGMVGPRPSR